MSEDTSFGKALEDFQAKHEAANEKYAEAVEQIDHPGEEIEAALEYMDDHAEALEDLVDDLIDALKDW